MESALRTAHYLLTGTDLEAPELEAVRGTEGLREANVAIGDTTLKVAVVHSLANARAMMEGMRAGKCDYAFVEVMACPGGCVGGGGQTYGLDSARIRRRMEAIYSLEGHRRIRMSHRNERVRALYDSYLGEPGSPRAHSLLHTSYRQRRLRHPDDRPADDHPAEDHEP